MIQPTFVQAPHALLLMIFSVCEVIAFRARQSWYRLMPEGHQRVLTLYSDIVAYRGDPAD
jgi:hypothetical protein